MKVSQAKRIAIESILACFGHCPVREKRQGDELWYCSPFREEHNPSFKVTVSKNLYYDFGEGKGGNALDLLINLVDTDVSGALSWLDDMSDLTAFKRQDNIVHSVVNEENPLQLVKARPCENKACIEYIHSRGIDLEIARKYIVDLYYMDTRTGKRYFGIGLRNLSGGYAVRNKYCKTLVGKSDISFIEGDFKQGLEDQRIEVFEGLSDFLSHRCLFRYIPHSDAIVLNSTSHFKKAVEFINSRGYQEITVWQDNDAAGKKLLSNFEKKFEGVAYVRSQSHIYQNHNDLNAYWKALHETSN